jgi:hypothetical protein
MKFRTTHEQLLRLPQYIDLLRSSKARSDQFVDAVSELALTDQGVYDLVEMWYFEADDDILSDLSESLYDYGYSA